MDPRFTCTMRSQSVLGLTFKIVSLGIIDSIGIWGAVSLAFQSSYTLLTLLILGVGTLNVVILSKRAYPLRYLLPGLVFLAAMVVYPLLNTFYVSFTNLQTGNLLSKDTVLHLLDERYYLPEDSSVFDYSAFSDDADALALALTASDGKVWIYETEELREADRSDPALTFDDAGTVQGIEGYEIVEGIDRYQILSRLEALAIPMGDQYLRLSGINEFKAYRKQYTYLAETDQLLDRQTGLLYAPIDGKFTAEDGTQIEPGYQIWIGGENYSRVFGNAAIRRDFVRVFVWTILWSLFSVLFSFSLGLGLALLLNDRALRFRFFYRTLLLVPYVMPVFISALVWRGMFDVNFGIINRSFSDWFGITVPWLTHPTWAKATLVFINVWLSFPYMMLISLGALQSIPNQLYEAARVDGAGMWKRFHRITLPLLMISLAPLLIGSFAFAFNNFTLIWLVTSGRPAVFGAATPAGATDILISWTYRIAFQGGVGNQLGLASAISVLIFFMVGTISAIGFRLTRQLEEVYK